MLEVRQALPEEADAITALHVLSWQDSYADLMPATFLFDVYPELCRQHWRSALADLPPGKVLVANRDGRLVGFAATWLHGTSAEVDNIHVHPDAQGAGIGLVLLKRAARELRAMGAKDLYLEVLDGNARALRFYMREGGAPRAAEPGTLHGVPVELIRVDWPDIGVLAGP